MLGQKHPQGILTSLLIQIIVEIPNKASYKEVKLLFKICLNSDGTTPVAASVDLIKVHPNIVFSEYTVLQDVYRQ